MDSMLRGGGRVRINLACRQPQERDKKEETDPHVRNP